MFIKHSRIRIKKMIIEGGGGVKKMNFGGFIHPWKILKFSKKILNFNHGFLYSKLHDICLIKAGGRRREKI